jgi:hypothetical protein
MSSTSPTRGGEAVTAVEPKPEFPNFEARTRAYVAYVEKWARDILANSEEVSDADRRAFEERLTRFRTCFDEFANFIKPIPRVDGIFLHMHKLIEASVFLGSGGAISDEARRFHRAPLSIGGAKGGKEAARKTKENADARWRNKAAELHKIHRPPFSQERLAKLIEDQIPEAPNRRQIVLFIRQLDRRVQANGAPQ